MASWKMYYLNLTEVFRCGADYVRLQVEWTAVIAVTPKADGHPVIVLPGFGAGDLSTAPLRNALTEKGYAAYGWNAGANLGVHKDTAERLKQRLIEVYFENNCQPVSLIGHSLGGIYARELAREFPEMVRDVQTVGTPFGAGIVTGHVPETLIKIIESLSPGHSLLNDKDMAERCLTPPPVPTTSIYSKQDGIGGWRACLNPDSPLTENVNIEASHIGLIWHPESFAVIFDRLAQPIGKWQPYAKPGKDKAPKNPDWKPNKSSRGNIFSR